MAKGIGSQSSLREANRASLLDCIHKFGAMTQVEIAEATGLSTATVSTLVHQLVDESVIETRNTVRNGRRATLVTLMHHQGLGIGLAIDRHSLRLSVMDFANTVLARHELPLAYGHKADSTLDRAMVLINETLGSIGASVDELVGVGIGVAAPVDTRSHRIEVPGILPGWEDVDLATPMRDAFRTTVCVDENSNLSTLCEYRMGAATGIGDFVYVDAGDGVGAGIMSNGAVWHGVTGLAGEIGHIQVDPLGSICSCGNRGCLNTVVEERRLSSLLSVTHGDMTMDDLVAAAVDGDPGCRRVISDLAVRIGSVSSQLCICVDPQLVVLGGKLSLAGDAFLSPFAESLQRLLLPSVLTPIEVKRAVYPIWGGSMGAALRSMDLSMSETGS